MHSAKQNIRCVGCGEMFKRAGGLMAHIEANTCPKITLEHFQDQRAHKEILKSFLTDPEKFQFPPGVDGETIVRNFGGWKRLKDGSLLDYDMNAPLGGRVLDPTKSSNVDLLNDRLLPEDDVVVGLKDMGLGKRYDATNDERSTTPEVPKSPKPALKFGAKKATTPAKEGKPKPDEKQRYIENTNPWDPNSKCFKPANFLHPVTGKYVCPHQNCRYVYRLEKRKKRLGY